MAMPKVADQTWRRIYHSRVAEVYESENENDYYKVVLEDMKPKYFYGELGFQNYQRYVYDFEMATMYSQDNAMMKKYR